MIVYYNVCDHCSSQSEMVSGSQDGVDFLFDTDSAFKRATNPTAFRMSRLQRKTFCDKECLLSYLKDCLDHHGFVKGE